MHAVRSIGDRTAGIGGGCGGSAGHGDEFRKEQSLSCARSYGSGRAEPAGNDIYRRHRTGNAGNRKYAGYGERPFGQ